MNKLLANMFLDACKIREDSYDKEGADKASAAAQKEREANPDNYMAGIVDYSTFYRKTMREAAEEAATKHGHPTMGGVIYYLMTYVWNDMHDWVKEQKPGGLPDFMMKATEEAWLGRAKTQNLPKPSSVSYKKAEGDFFIGAMAAFNIMGYILPPKWVLNIMQNKNVSE